MIDMLLCPVVTVRKVGTRYSRQTILHAFPPKEQKSTRRHHKEVAANPRQEVELTDTHRLIAAQTVAEMKSDHPVLWQGKFDQFGARRGGGSYESQSDADLAMVGYIAKSLANKVSTADELSTLTEAVMGLSGLAQRTKWIERADYRQRTVTKGCAEIEVQPLVDWGLSGDVRHAKTFAQMFRGQFLYVHKAGYWLNWQDERWQRCDKGEALNAAKEVAMRLVKVAAEQLAEDPDKGKRLIRESAQASMLPRLKAMLELAASEKGLGAKPEQLDSHADMLGVDNGVVNLRMGWCQPNEPSLLITKRCSAKYDKEAECPRWLRFLGEIFVQADGSPDYATIASVQLLLGLTLTGEAGEEIIVFCVGFGANGKSILSNVITAILGEYAKTAPPSLLSARRTDDHGARPDMAMLPGARLVSINELPGGMHLDEVVAKQIAAREPIAARHLYGDFFSFVPSFTPWVRTNHKPIVKGDDDGIWRRIVILPFRRTFEKHEQNPFLETQLMGERDGILAWMIEGAQKYYRDGFRLSPAMKREMAQYRKESDLLGEFLEGATVVALAARVEQGTLYSSWQFWCNQNGVRPGAKKTFTQRLAERGFSTTRSNGKYFYSGLKVRTEQS